MSKIVLKHQKEVTVLSLLSLHQTVSSSDPQIFTHMHFYIPIAIFQPACML